MKTKNLKLNEKYVKSFFQQSESYPYEQIPEEKISPLQEFYIKQREDVIKESKPQDRVILDIGTGQGRFALHFAKAGAKRVIGIDISPIMLEIARQKALENNLSDRTFFEHGDAESLVNFPDNYFDIVCSIGTLVHLPSPIKAMHEIFRVCKVDGLVIIGATNNDFRWKLKYYGAKEIIWNILRIIYYRYLPFIARRLLYRYFTLPLSPLAREYTEKELLNLFPIDKFKIEKVLSYGRPTVFFTVFARKIS